MTTWYTKDKLPNLTESEFYSEAMDSVPVLGRYKSGHMFTVFVRCVDGDITWYDCSSEMWDVTEYITHWAYLPEFQG